MEVEVFSEAMYVSTRLHGIKSHNAIIFIKIERIETSATKKIRTLIFRDITQRVVVVPYRRFGDNISVLSPRFKNPRIKMTRNDCSDEVIRHSQLTQSHSFRVVFLWLCTVLVFSLCSCAVLIIVISAGKPTRL
jgi:hypothetical protein